MVTREGVEIMHRLLAVLVAVAGIVGFAAAGLAACGHDLDVADTSTTTVATDTATPPPIVTDQSGG
jgi:hypothetical protein